MYMRASVLEMSNTSALHKLEHFYCYLNKTLGN